MPSKIPVWKGVRVEKFCLEHRDEIYKEAFRLIGQAVISFRELMDMTKHLNDPTKISFVNCSVCKHESLKNEPLPQYKTKIDRHIEAF